MIVKERETGNETAKPSVMPGEAGDSPPTGWSGDPSTPLGMTW